jgi:hypothetical protein
MQIELTVQEIQVVQKALKSYENEPHTTGMLTSVMLTVLTSKSERDGEEIAEREHVEAARSEAKRKLETASIGLKLLSVLQQPSEFETHR